MRKLCQDEREDQRALLDDERIDFACQRAHGANVRPPHLIYEIARIRKPFDFTIKTSFPRREVATSLFVY